MFTSRRGLLDNIGVRAKRNFRSARHPGAIRNLSECRPSFRCLFFGSLPSPLILHISTSPSR